MAIPEKPHNMWVHHDRLGGDVHHLWQGQHSTSPIHVRASLEKLAKAYNTPLEGLHFRVGRMDDIHAFGNTGHWDESATNPDGTRNSYRKLRPAPPELVDALLALVKSI
jgi:hypothetical protein